MSLNDLHDSKKMHGSNELHGSNDPHEFHDLRASHENKALIETLVIGLTGGIGTGKSTASRYLVGKGFVHIDADAISRRITEKIPGVDNPVLDEIAHAFDGEGACSCAMLDGNSSSSYATLDDEGVSSHAVLDDEGVSSHAALFHPDGSLDRKAMADLVFNDPEKKKTLEDILFRHIIAEIRRQIDAAKEDASANFCKEKSDTANANAKLILLDVPLLFEAGLDCLCDYVILITTDHDVRIQRVMERDNCTVEDIEARMRNQMSDDEKIALADFVVDNSSTKKHLYKQLDEVFETVLLEI